MGTFKKTRLLDMPEGIAGQEVTEGEGNQKKQQVLYLPAEIHGGEIVDDAFHQGMDQIETEADLAQVPGIVHVSP